MGKAGEQKALIGYCGLYCGDCPGYQGTIADLARDLRQELRRARYDKLAAALAQIPFFSAFQDYRTCCNVLGALAKTRCKRACRNGGGDPGCKVRACARKKGYEGCWECAAFGTCGKGDFLQPYHGQACARNVRRIRRAGTAAFVKGQRHWTCR